MFRLRLKSITPNDKAEHYTSIYEKSMYVFRT